MTDLRSVFMDYRAFLARVDARAGALFRRHAQHITCHRGCYYCCTSISITPLEFAWVGAHIAELRRTGAAHIGLGPDADLPRIPEVDEFAHTIPEDSELREARRTPRCALLKEGVCSVYTARPVICRVHGLLLAYPVFEYDGQGRRVQQEDSEVAVVWCDLNFADTEVSAASEEDIISMDEVYREIDELNQRFLATAAGRAFGGRRQIDLDGVLTLSPSP